MIGLALLLNMLGSKRQSSGTERAKGKEQEMVCLKGQDKFAREG